MEHAYKNKRVLPDWAALLSKYLLLMGALSFLGWLFESTLALLHTGSLGNAGALSLPLCPIYASSLLGLYFLAGTPDRGRGILKNVAGKRLLWGLYLALAFVLPTLAELAVGTLFEHFFGMKLWDYSHIPLNYKGYICFFVSAVWAVLIFLFMKFLFMPIKRRLFAIEAETAIALSAVLLVFVGLDVLF